jgi:exodeoxyribonuclease-5
MGEDLLSFNKPVLVLGDPGQLPPVMDTAFFTSRELDFQLTEVHRQALGSPVIQLATLAREGRALRCGQHGDSCVLSRCDGLSIDDLLAVDQVIVGTHRMRHRINDQIRRRLGHSGTTPAIGEKVVCLRNDKASLRNSTLWTVVGSKTARGGFVALTVEDDNRRRVEVDAPVDGFNPREGSGADLPGQPFAFGYAITCHKSQGSQWGSVMVIDESRVFRGRWLYTAITRAADRVTVVLP